MARERYRPFRQRAICDRCGHGDITWVKSARGKWYLAAITRDKDGTEWADTYSFHSKDCAAFAEERAVWAARPSAQVMLFATLTSEVRQRIVEAYDNGVKPDVADLLDQASVLAESDEQHEEIEKLRRACAAAARAAIESPEGPAGE